MIKHLEEMGCVFIRHGGKHDWYQNPIDGLKLAQFVYWPNPIHEGNGRAVIYIDEQANEAQRTALTEIATGNAGPGGPFEIFSSTYSEPPKVVFGSMQLERSNKEANLKFGDLAHAEIEPVRSAMDNSVADVHMVLPSGFIWQDAELVNTKLCEVNADGLKFRHENSNAFLSEVAYNI
ncbi:DUF1326 domain-containing protein [Chlorogloeopsis fritschii]|uniref:DUF1326 domain-containing protein n=1 Tax=Chlorogloeopsis fritschii TaxID=1124 RepID=UPI0023F44DAA|nr:DUF1326 domain-containing protein [Chlorogloeopsis fritschii]